MFINDRRAVRSRSPIHGYFTYEKGLNNRTHIAYQGFVYREHQFDNITLSSTSTSEFIVYHSYTTSRHYFDRIFLDNRTILFSNPSLSVIGNRSILQQSGQRFHLENIYEVMLTQENSFYFDSTTQMLYYHAQKDEHPQTATVILPILENIVSIVNAHTMEFHAIGFAHSAWIGSTINKSVPIDGRAAADYLDTINGCRLSL